MKEELERAEDEIRKAKEKEEKQMKEIESRMMECSVCWDEFDILNGYQCINECKSIICNECISDHVKSMGVLDMEGNIECFGQTCNSIIKGSNIMKLLNVESMNHYLKCRDIKKELHLKNEFKNEYELKLKRYMEAKSIEVNYHYIENIS